MKKLLLFILLLGIIPLASATFDQYGKEEGGHFNNPFTGTSEQLFLNDTNLIGLNDKTHPLALDVDLTANGDLEGVLMDTNTIYLINLSNGDTINSFTTGRNPKGQYADASIDPGQVWIAGVFDNGTTTVFTLLNLTPTSLGVIDQIDLGSNDLDGAGVRCGTWGSGNTHCVWVDNEANMTIYRYDYDNNSLVKFYDNATIEQSTSSVYYNANRVPTQVAISSTEVALIPYTQQTPRQLRIYAYDVGGNTKFTSFGTSGELTVDSSMSNENDGEHPSVIATTLGSTDVIAIAYEDSSVTRFHVYSEDGGTFLNTPGYTPGGSLNNFESLSQPFHARCKISDWGTSSKSAVGVFLANGNTGNQFTLYLYNEDGDTKTIVIDEGTAGSIDSTDSYFITTTVDLDNDGTTELITSVGGDDANVSMVVMSCNDNDINGIQAGEVIQLLTNQDDHYAPIADDFDQDGEMELWMQRGSKSLLFDNLEQPAVGGGGAGTPFNESLLDECRDPCIFKDTFPYTFTLSDGGWSIFNSDKLDIDTSTTPDNGQLEVFDIGDWVTVSHQMNQSKVQNRIPISTFEFQIEASFGDPVEILIKNVHEASTPVHLIMDSGDNSLRSKIKEGGITKEKILCTSCLSASTQHIIKVVMFTQDVSIASLNGTQMDAYSYTVSLDGSFLEANIPFFDVTDRLDSISFLKYPDTSLKLDNVNVYRGTNLSNDTTSDIIFGTAPSVGVEVKCYGGFCLNKKEEGHVAFDCDAYPTCCKVNSDGELKVDSQLCTLGNFFTTTLAKITIWILANMLYFIVIIGIFVFVIPYIYRYFM